MIGTKWPCLSAASEILLRDIQHSEHPTTRSNTTPVRPLRGLTGVVHPRRSEEKGDRFIFPLEIEAEQALVAANRELIARFEKKIQATLARSWGKDKPTPE